MAAKDVPSNPMVIEGHPKEEPNNSGQHRTITENVGKNVVELRQEVKANVRKGLSDNLR
eukprot:CAMPEP_0118656604 /NCGR_PEP_ID=MMETSP0785-20121206/13574_1 /TAXON_ID=91992 /ORGANISM="Bolidomonas pacifica, Strain CCMP 1866" /LENGTH=58 /DNA_ID=CAMNT_0006549467 /DNA_START=544 /DNA_END=720 /DNA_ORIENTATION=-